MPFCRRCGNELKEGETVCPVCGTPVSNAPLTQQSVPAARAPSQKKGIPTIAVIAVVMAVMTVGMIALSALMPQPAPPEPGPEGGYQITFGFQDVMISSENDTLLNIASDGKYYNPSSGSYDLDEPSNEAWIGLLVRYEDGTESHILNIAKGTMSGGSSDAMSADNVTTIHVDGKERNLELGVMMVSSYDTENGAHKKNTYIDIAEDEAHQWTQGMMLKLALSPHAVTETFDIKGDLKPCAVSGKITVTITPLP